jgi:uncharacterized protein (TIGR02145 family)
MKLLLFTSLFFFHIISFFSIVNAQSIGTFIDNRDNILYKTVTINGDTWMSENLRSITFRNGDNILEAKTKEDLFRYNKMKMPCFVKNRINAEDGTVIDFLTYNWYAITDPRGLAPNGFHISTNSEWGKLIEYCGDSKSASIMLRSSRGFPTFRIGELEIKKVCPNCKNWNSEYRSKVACHVCKDTRQVYDYTTKPTVNNTNGTNTLGFNWQYGSNYVSLGEEGPNSLFYAQKPFLFDLFAVGPVVLGHFSDGEEEVNVSVRCVKDKIIHIEEGSDYEKIGKIFEKSEDEAFQEDEEYQSNNGIEGKINSSTSNKNKETNTSSQINSVNPLRDPEPKEFANINWDGTYPLYSFVDDVEIKPDQFGRYNFWYATNEDKTPRIGSLEKGYIMRVHKFRNLEEYRVWAKLSVIGCNCGLEQDELQNLLIDYIVAGLTSDGYTPADRERVARIFCGCIKTGYFNDYIEGKELEVSKLVGVSKILLPKTKSLNWKEITLLLRGAEVKGAKLSSNFHISTFDNDNCHCLE